MQKDLNHNIEVDVTSGQRHWFAFRFYFNNYEIIERMIAANGYDTFYPFAPSAKPSQDVESQGNRRLLPSVLFVHCDDEFAERGYQQLRIKATPVTQQKSGNPVLIPDIQIESLKLAVASGYNIFERVNPSDITGGHVRVIDGVFKGAEGYVAKVHTNKRFVIKVDGVVAFATTYLPPYILEPFDRWHLVKMKRNANVAELFVALTHGNLQAFVPEVWNGHEYVNVFGKDFLLVRCEEDKLQELKRYFTSKKAAVISDVTANNLTILRRTTAYQTTFVDDAVINHTTGQYYVGDNQELTGLKVLKTPGNDNLYIPIEHIGKVLEVNGVDPETLDLQNADTRSAGK